MNLRAIFVAVIILIMGVILCSCGKIEKPVLTVNPNSKIYTSEKVDRSSPELVAKQFYASETKMDTQFLMQFFYKPNISDISYIKKKIKAFQVTDILLDKVVKEEISDNIAVLSCSYFTKFQGLPTMRPDVEVVAMIHEKDGWLILNDTQELQSDKAKWLEDTELKQKQDLWNNSVTSSIFDNQDKFDSDNKSFMDKGNQRLQQALNNGQN